VQQLHERVDVVALEGTDVPGQQGALLLAQGSRGEGSSRVELRHGGAGPLQGAVDRRHRGVEQIGDVGRGPGEHLAQHEHRPLSRRQVLQRGDERQPHAVLQHRPLGGVVGADHLGVADRLQPRPQRRPALEPVQRLPGAHQRLLHGVVGVVGRAEHPVAVAGALTAELLELRRLRLLQWTVTGTPLPWSVPPRHTVDR
jgi:hypothetical protein